MDSLEVYKMGKKARRDGKPATANPFKFGSKEYTYWWDGWVTPD